VDVTDERAEVDKQTMLETDWFDCTFAVVDFAHAEVWARKVHAEVQKGKTVVAIMPARTSLKWFHDLVLQAASDVRFVQGGIMPNNSVAEHGKHPKALPAACIAIFRGYIPRRERDKNKTSVGILKLHTSFTTDSLDMDADVQETAKKPGRE
jgi:hypothetical protein